MTSWLTLFAAAVGAAAVSAAITDGARRYALRRDLLDHPGRRRSHSVPTPRGGGLGIAVVCTLGGLWLAWIAPASRPALLAFAVGIALIAGIGALDDHRPQSARLRLSVHVLAAALYVFALLGWPPAAADWGVWLLAVFALVGLVNIWNFMDGIDGLAASQALLVAAALALVTTGGRAMLAVLLAGAAAGFLPFNTPRARIFLGDVGSGALGFALGALLLAGVAQQRLHWSGALLLISAFGLDAGLTLLKRVVQGRSWWRAHREHLYQWLVRRGRSHARVTLAYAGWTSGAALAMLGTRNALEPTVLTTVCAIVMGLGGAVWCILRRRLRTEARGRQG